MNKIIAVDGPAGSGKSSIAKLLAEKIGFGYFDSGLAYRAITYFFIENKIPFKDEELVEKKLSDVNLYFKDDKVFLNDVPITDKLKDDGINKEVANYAKLKSVRKFIRFIQRRFAAENNCVMDGRDIGTVVFPDAFCKFYLDADIDERSKRRFEELKKSFPDKTLESVKKDLIMRDYLDRTRKESPLIFSPDAVVIDSSNLSLSEVLSFMIDHYNQQLDLGSGVASDSDSGMSFLSALNDFSEKTSKNKSKKILKGVVVGIDEDGITLDIGEKNDAFIDKDEARQLIAENKVKKGEELEVIHLGNYSRGIKVSKLIADKNKSKVLIEKAFIEQKPISGKVIKVVRGGFIISFDDNNAFCPYSEFELKPVNSESQIGQVFDFLVVENQNSNIVVSRKKILQEIHANNLKEFYSNINKDMLLSGKVVAFIRAGALVEVKEGVVLLLRNEDISWKYIRSADSVLSKNQEIEVKIIDFDPDKQTANISLKELQVDPFISFSEVYRVGDVLEGVVKRIEDFGAFVEVEDGLDGLLHVKNLSWYRKIDHPKQVLKPGQKIKVKLLSIMSSRRKISLGLRELEKNPWDNMSNIYPTGSIVYCDVTAVEKNAIYLLVDNKFDGFIEIANTYFADDVDLTEKIEVGQKVFGIVKNVSYSKKRLELGLKKKSDNPWDDFESSFKMDSTIRGKIVNIHENGVDAEIFDGIVGFCHSSQLMEDEGDVNIGDKFKVGDVLSFKVQSFNKEKKDLKLSRKQFLLDSGDSGIRKYLKKESVERVTLGNMLNQE